MINFSNENFKGVQHCNKGLDQETVKYVYPYFLRSTYSSSFMDLI